MPNKKKRYNGLTHEERMFALNILAGYDHTEAYQIAYPKASKETAKSNAFKKLTLTHIQKFLEDRRALLCNKAEKKAEDIIHRLEEIGFVNVKDQKKIFGRTYKFSDSVKSIIALGDYHGLFNHDNDKKLTGVEITIRNASDPQ